MLWVGTSLPQVRDATREPPPIFVRFRPRSEAAKADAVAPWPPWEKPNLDWLRLEAAWRVVYDGESRAELGDEYNRVVYEPSHKSDRLRCKSVDNYVMDGGAILRELGVWPWACFDGPLPPNWRDAPDVADSLEAWHRDGVDRILRVHCEHIAEDPLRRRSADPDALRVMELHLKARREARRHVAA